jgi:hypothetical protein
MSAVDTKEITHEEGVDLDTFSNSGVQLHVEWTKEHESILVEWADKAMCYRWLHSKAHQHYARSNMWFTIPVIVMSTITGTANFAQEKLPEETRGFFSMAVGSVNIFAGILTTIAQFLKVSELNEAHRVASIAWDKFYRNTKVELAKSPAERLPVIQMLKHSKEEFDRLMETSPSISEKVIDEFNNTFSDGVSKIKGKLDKDSLSKRQLAFLELRKPEICDTIESTSGAVYKAPPMGSIKNGVGQTRTAIELARKAVDLKKKQDRIEDIISRFEKTKQRRPTTREICDELDDQDMMGFVEHYVASSRESISRSIPSEQNVNMIIKGENNV